jgi:subtilase family serine protease
VADGAAPARHRPVLLALVIAVICAGLAFASPGRGAAAPRFSATSRFGGAGAAASCLSIDGDCGFGPVQFRGFYGLNRLYSAGDDGTGQTIAVIDSYGDPQAAANLAAFDRSFHLRRPPKFTVIAPAGRIPRFNPDNSQMTGWATEADLDVQYAHALAPGADILLVETPTDETEGTAGFPQMIAAENYVLRHHLAQVISQSFGATEQTFPSHHALLDLRSAFTRARTDHVTVLAATGDEGATGYSNAAGTLEYTHRAVGWPASDPLVTAVGGLTLSLNRSGQPTAPPVGWSGSGGGRSTVFARPSWQGQSDVRDQVGTSRGIPDVAMSADPAGGALVYLGSDATGGGSPGLQTVGGTSEATPQFAAVVAIADQVAGHPLGFINPALYALEAAHAPGIVDVTSGDNTATFPQNGRDYTVAGFTAGPGYDLVTGVGTVDAERFVPELVSEVHALDRRHAR